MIRKIKLDGRKRTVDDNKNRLAKRIKENDDENNKSRMMDNDGSIKGKGQLLLKEDDN